MEEYCAACRLLADDLNAMRVGVAGGDTKLTHYECFISDEKEETSERLNLRGECEVCHEYAYARDSLEPIHDLSNTSSPAKK